MHLTFIAQLVHQAFFTTTDLSDQFYCLTLFHPKCRTLHFPLLNFVRFQPGHFSRFLMSPSMAALPSSILIFHRLLYGADCLIVQIVNKDIFPSSESQRAPLPAGLHGIDHNPLNAGVQLIFHLHNSPPIETVSPLCLKASVGDYPEISSKDRVNDTHCFPFSYRAGLLITGSCQVAQAAFACGKSLLTAPSHLQSIICPRKRIQEDLLHNLPRNRCENGWSVVPQSILTLPEGWSDVCVIRNLPRLPQPFTDVIMWPCSDTGQFSQRYLHRRSFLLRKKSSY